MKLTYQQSGNFTPCPEYTGRAVCVDVTPLEKQHSQFGERDVFRLVFEVELAREDGSPYCVWSAPFTPSLNEKANFRRFLRNWRARDLNAQELAEFDTETLLGQPAFLVVTHSEGSNGETYANIAAITPHKPAHGQPLAPSGKFVRKKDRPAKDAPHTGSTGDAPGAAYRRAGQPAPEPNTPTGRDDWMTTVVHVGKHAGVQLGDLDAEAVEALLEKWVPIHEQNASPKAADKRLHAALLQAKAALAATATATEEIPY
jgi:hypothetical protein